MAHNLFISFSGLIRLIADRKVTEAELSDALFYFGCTRGHVHTPWEDDCNELTWASKNPDEQ